VIRTLASIQSVQGIPNYIYPEKPQTGFKDAMSRPEAQEWADAHQKEYQGFRERNAFSKVLLPKAAKELGTTTLRDYKIDNGVFCKRKVHMCVQGDQQRDRVHDLRE
jgi:hypothetical protein